MKQNHRGRDDRVVDDARRALIGVVDEDDAERAADVDEYRAARHEFRQALRDRGQQEE
jgi:hypothetical protein